MDFSIIRPATPSDAPHIATIKIQSWREAYAQILRPETLAKLNHKEETTKHQNRIESHEQILVSTTTQNIPIAYAHWIQLNPNQNALFSDLIQTDWPHPNMLAALYVHPKHYRQGHGTALIAACAKLAQSQGYQGMMIGVFAANTRAHTLYTKLGATLFRAGHYEVDGTPYPELLLQFDHLAKLTQNFPK